MLVRAVRRRHREWHLDAGYSEFCTRVVICNPDRVVLHQFLTSLESFLNVYLFDPVVFGTPRTNNPPVLKTTMTRVFNSFVIISQRKRAGEWHQKSRPSDLLKTVISFVPSSKGNRRRPILSVCRPTPCARRSRPVCLAIPHGSHCTTSVRRGRAVAGRSGRLVPSPGPTKTHHGGHTPTRASVAAARQHREA